MRGGGGVNSCDESRLSGWVTMPALVFAFAHQGSCCAVQLGLLWAAKWRSRES